MINKIKSIFRFLAVSAFMSGDFAPFRKFVQDGLAYYDNALRNAFPHYTAQGVSNMPYVDALLRELSNIQSLLNDREIGSAKFVKKLSAARTEALAALQAWERESPEQYAQFHAQFSDLNGRCREWFRERAIQLSQELTPEPEPPHLYVCN